MGKRRHRYIYWILATALLLSSLAGCGDQPAEETDSATEETETLGEGEVLTMGYAADNIFSLNYDTQNSFNPFTSESTKNLMMVPLLYDFMYNVDENYEATPGLLLSYETTDYRWWEFKVDTDVQFSDGSNLTAYDVAYSLQQARNSELYGNRLSFIFGVNPQNEETLVVSLNVPNSQFPALLNIPVIKNESGSEWVPLGTGMYKMDSNYTSLVPNTYNEHAQNLPLDQIYLKEFVQAAEIIPAFEDSTLDLVLNDPLGLDHLGYGSSNEVRYYNTTNMHYIGFNSNSSFFSNAEYRAAMTYAINRSYIVTNLMSGCAAESTLPISPVSSLYNSSYAERFSFSMEKCKKALEDAEVTDVDDDGLLEYMVTGIPMEIDLDFIVNSDSSAKVSAARDIVANLQSIGLNVNLRELSWEEYLVALTNGDFDMYYGEVRLGADFDLTRLVTYGGALNYGRFTNSEYLNVIQTYLASSEEDRQSNCNAMLQYMMENMPIVCICFEKQQVLTHRNVITGMAPTQYNIFNNFLEWTVNLDGQ